MGEGVLHGVASVRAEEQERDKALGRLGEATPRSLTVALSEWEPQQVWREECRGLAFPQASLVRKCVNDRCLTLLQCSTGFPRQAVT